MCREWKIMACKALLKIGMVLLLLLLYVAFWYTCDVCIIWFACFACAFSVFGSSFVAPVCVAGLGLTLIKGIHLGTGPLHFDVKWDG